jgi:SRSO17 transposase
VRSTGERKYYFTNHPADTPRMAVVRAIKARWACEQAHQQLKDQLGLEHYEGRSWLGLHHHALLAMRAFGYLQHGRLDSVLQAGKNFHPMHRIPHCSRHCRRYAAPSSPCFILYFTFIALIPAPR